MPTGYPGTFRVITNTNWQDTCMKSQLHIGNGIADHDRMGKVYVGEVG